MAESRSSLTPPPATLYPPPATSGNPYLAAQGEWDRRIGTPLQWIRRLLVSLALESVALLVLAAYAWVAPGKIQYVPYVVEVSDVGQVRAIGLIPHGWSATNKAPLDFVIREWLHAVRTIPDSAILWGKQWDRAKAFMTTKVQQKLSPYAVERDAMQKMGQVVDIEITSVLPMDTEWQLLTVEWKERLYSQQGKLMKTDDWKAHVQVAIFPPDPKKLSTPNEFRNTLGVFVQGYQWGVKATGKALVTQQTEKGGP
jgi:type IV secretory pathway TrbF-like protein